MEHNKKITSTLERAGNTGICIQSSPTQLFAGGVGMEPSVEDPIMIFKRCPKM